MNRHLRWLGFGRGDAGVPGHAVVTRAARRRLSRRVPVAWRAWLPAAVGLACLAGCDDGCKDCVCVGPDVTAPAAPRGLYSITGDNEVTLVWLANTESDLSSYSVWWSTTYEGEYHRITTLSPSGEYDEQYVDRAARNGETYYYAVSATDASGNESDLSLENVWDTPRPEGTAHVTGLHTAPATAGFDFDDGHTYGRTVPADALDADFYYEYVPETGESFLVTAHPDYVLIQDMGHAASFGEIGFSPGAGEGWSPTGIVEAIEGHIYTLRILDDPLGFYAKVWLTGIGPTQVAFRWAFQTQPGNQQLSVP
jgi:hypothetical protein